MTADLPNPLVRLQKSALALLENYAEERLRHAGIIEPEEAADPADLRRIAAHIATVVVETWVRENLPISKLRRSPAAGDDLLTRAAHVSRRKP